MSAPAAPGGGPGAPRSSVGPGASPDPRSDAGRAAAAERTTARMADALRAGELRAAAARTQLRALGAELDALELAVARLRAAAPAAAVREDPALRERAAALRREAAPEDPRAHRAIADDLERAADRLRRLREPPPEA